MRPQKITVSEWADTFRYLNPTTSAEPGRWKTSRTPYLEGVMDAFSDPFVDEITVIAASQVGKTEAIYNMLAFVIDQDPGPTLVVMPRENDAKSVSYNRVLPMLEGSPALSRHLPTLRDDITKLEYRFDRMIVYFAGSNSPADLASRPIRYLFLDEVDKYPRFSGREADPIKLASERQKTFWNKKTVKVSTPTTREGYIFREYEKSDRRRFHVPCPHCGQMQVLVFSQIKWPEDERSAESIKNERLAWYECRFCEKRIEDYQKPKMLSGGSWIPDVKEKSKHRGFWINSLYSPWLTWSDIACEFLKSKDYISLLMNFVNSWLGEVWEEKIEETSIDRVRQLTLPYQEGAVPDEVFVLTAGVDVQKDHFYVSIRGWGLYAESWLIRAVRVEEWDEVAEVLFKTQYPRISTEETIGVQLACIDSGYRTDEVYEFCRYWRDLAKPIKGQDELAAGKPYRATKLDALATTGSTFRGSLVLWHINTSHYKDKISRLVTNEEAFKWHLFESPGEDYLKQFTSEAKVLVRNKRTGDVKEVWKKKSSAIPNHFWDTEVYSVAAADIIRALYIREEEVNVYEPTEQRQHSRGSWIRKKSGTWL